MSIKLEQIKLLRDKTGAGVTDCKKALDVNDNDFEKAVKYLMETQVMAAEKKLNRNTEDGLVVSYIHSSGKLGVLLELNCETDFVARRSEFSELANLLAIQVASNSDIQFIDGGPPEANLLDQACIREPETLVRDYIKRYIAILGENIKVGSFSRIHLGREIRAVKNEKI